MPALANGAHLAVASLLGLKSRRDFSRIVGVQLFYGLFDFSGTPSVRNAAKDALVLDGRRLLDGLYRLTANLDDEARRIPPLSPLYGDLSGMPPALIFVGGLDPLIDDSLLLAGRWESAIPVELHRVPSAPHGYIRHPIAIARKTLKRSQAWVNERLA